MEQITGVSRHTFHLLCAEAGLDLSRFPDAAHLACLRRDISGPQGECRQASERADASNQCVCEDGTGSSSAYHGSYSDVSRREVWALAQTAAATRDAEADAYICLVVV